MSAIPVSRGGGFVEIEEEEELLADASDSEKIDTWAGPTFTIRVMFTTTLELSGPHSKHGPSVVAAKTLSRGVACDLVTVGESDVHYTSVLTFTVTISGSGLLVPGAKSVSTENTNG